jgi:hypothetical protein
MAENPDTGPKQIEVTDPAHAPFIYFELPPLFGYANGIVSITLSAHRPLTGKNGVI